MNTLKLTIILLSLILFSSCSVKDEKVTRENLIKYADQINETYGADFLLWLDTNSKDHEIMIMTMTFDEVFQKYIWLMYSADMMGGKEESLYFQYLDQSLKDTIHYYTALDQKEYERKFENFNSNKLYLDSLNITIKDYGVDMIFEDYQLQKVGVIAYEIKNLSKAVLTGIEFKPSCKNGNHQKVLQKQVSTSKIKVQGESNSIYHSHIGYREAYFLKLDYPKAADLIKDYDPHYTISAAIFNDVYVSNTPPKLELNNLLAFIDSYKLWDNSNWDTP